MKNFKKLQTKAEAIGVIFLALTLAFLPAVAQNVQPTAVPSSGEAQAKQGFIRPHPAVRSPFHKAPPKLTPEETEKLERALQQTHGRIVTPVDPSFRSDTVKPTSPPTEPNFLSAIKKESAMQDPGTFTFFRNHSFTGAETNNGASTIGEPSLGTNGRAIFWTGNWYASVSGDGGQTFNFINPADNFPADGTLDPVNGGFCCDQVVYYDRTRGAVFWLLQYNADANTNTQRIAVANNQANLLNNNWFWYDWSPASFGFPASGYWLDFPDLAVSDNYLYMTSNVFLLGSGSTTTAVIARFPLNEMSQGQAFTYSYLVTDLPGLRCTHGATSTMFFGAHASNAFLRFYRWDEGSGTITWNDVWHSGYNTGTMTAPGPDGRDWAGKADDRIFAAWNSGNVVGYMWNAAQGGSFPFPHVEVFRLTLGVPITFVPLIDIWSANVAWLYPSVHPNDRGHLGGTIAYGGGSLYPGAAAWIVDDINGNIIAPLENVSFASGNSGPAGNRWGDYLTTRRHVPYGNTWTGTGYALVGGPNNAVPVFTWFGRERDMPPATNTIYVDRVNTSGYEDGSAAHPYNTVVEGHFAALAGDIIIIQTNNYPEPVTLSTPVTVKSQGGSVFVGRGP